MKTTASKFLWAVRPLLKRLLSLLLEEFPYASILAQDSTAMQCAVSSAGTGVSEQDMLTKRGFVVRVHNGQGLGEYAFCDIDDERLPKIVSGVKRMAAGIAGHDKMPEDAPAKGDMQTEYEIDPEALGSEEIVRRLTDIRARALAQSDKLLDVNLRLIWQKNHKMFLSANRDLSQDVLWTNGSIYAMAAKGEEIKDYYRGFSILGGAELLNDMASPEALGEIARTTVELLDSLPIPPGEYDCVCDPDTTGMIVHEAFGHGVEMDMFVKNRAQAKAFVGKRVASDLVNMHDGAACARECATFLFDDEGTAGQDTLVIEKGILRGGYADAVSASRLGVSPTGNGRRQAFDHKAYTRMTNTFFEPGNDTLEDMIASISYGFLLENPNSGMEDPKNWGIQCMVNIAREIKDGKLTGRVYSPIVLTGYVPDLLKSISMMSGKTRLGGSGFCGKGYKEWVKVSDGGPYMKARIRLG